MPWLVSWIFDFQLCREVDLKAVVERYGTCQDSRSFAPSPFDDDEDLAITRIPQMRKQKGKLLEGLQLEMATRTFE
ncbi:hypothetical protein R1flu_002658 [Riccia fluitans]|uniref:Uncharacterized protein n=1 Tax=Riccia fluitans TaxID=41844 RepID=A0ABD1Y6Q7_9MARC